MTLEEVLSARPAPGTPRDYRFPDFDRAFLRNGLQVLAVHLPGRPLISANLVIRRGAAEEPAELGGATVLASRAATEGTENYPGLALVEAAERLGATLHAEASWDAFVGAVDVAGSRLGSALELLDELIERPAFEEADVARLRDERLSDLLQVRADPRRRAERAFASVIYAPGSPYARPAGGDEATVPGLDAAAIRSVHTGLLDPARAALVVGGDLAGLDVVALAERAFGRFGASAASGAAASGFAASGSATSGSAAVGRTPARAPAASPAAAAVERPIVRLYHHPGAVQTELRIGHVGLARKTPDFHAVQLMATILGGLFNSRLQMNLREARGFTYGVGASFEMRRAAGPFAVRTAVQTAATVPSIGESLVELNRMRDTDVTEAELKAARDYLVGVFPLRFEVPEAVVAALGGLFSLDLPDDELARYRERTEAVSVSDIRRVALAHIHPERIAIVAVGDADVVGKDLEAAGYGELEVIREELPVAEDGDSEDEPEPEDETEDGSAAEGGQAE
jgi:zinc protease